MTLCLNKINYLAMFGIMIHLQLLKNKHTEKKNRIETFTLESAYFRFLLLVFKFSEFLHE